MKIIPSDSALAKTIEAICNDIHQRDGVVVFLEHKKSGFNLQDIPGLDDVLEHARTGVPVVMLGWLDATIEQYARDSRWHAALGYPNVVFRRLPEAIDEIAGTMNEAIGHGRPADPLAIAALTAKAVDDTARNLEHFLGYAKDDPERMAQWLDRARSQFGGKTDDEIITILAQVRQMGTVPGQFAGQVFPDTCVDVEGTLFGSDGAFRPNVLEDAVRQANGNPITVWTGGDVKAARKMLLEVKVPYKLLPKQMLAGATVKNVFDDLAEEEFRERYNVRYERYIRVAA